MKIGPKYKIARRLGAPIFEKTQTPKYTLSLARKERSGIGAGRPKSEFGRELLEKQKTRFTYGTSDRQLRNYVASALRASNPTQKLFSLLESRLDNVLFRAGLAKTRAQARQVASHGHVLVNDKRVSIPSIQLKKGNKITLRPGSAQSPLFGEVTERIKGLNVPAWLEVDAVKREVIVKGEAVYTPNEQIFDLGAVIEFCNR